MSRFAKFYLVILGLTLVFAVLAKFFGRHVDFNEPGLPGVIAARIFGGEKELLPLEENMRVEESFEQIEINWPLGDVRVAPLPDGETVPRISYSGKMAKGADRKDLFGYRVTDKTLKIKTGDSGWKFGFEIGEGRFAITKPEVDLVLELPKTWKGSLTVNTVSGDVGVGFLGLDELKIKTVSGDLVTDWRLNAKKTDVRTVSGDLKLFGHLTDVVGESVSGDLHLGLSPEGRYDVETRSVSGDVENTLPRPAKGKTVTGTIRLKTVSGNIIIAPMEKNPDDTI